MTKKATKVAKAVVPVATVPVATKAATAVATKVGVITAPMEAVMKKIGTGHGSKSAKIRYLAAEGVKRVDIAKYMDCRYQMVRNILLTPLKKKAELL